MRKLIMWNLVTLDGFFEGPKSWDIDWHDTIWGDELEKYAIEQSKSTGMLLFGRVTYEGMAGYWPSQKGEVADFMNTIPKIVFSKTLKKAEWNNTRLVKAKPEEEVAKLKQQPGKDLFVFGSANLSATLLTHGLFDELDLALAPVVLGGGNPLFKSSADRIKMTLLEARPLKSGGVILRYEPDRKKAKSR
ncbi:MAG: dihydrofolate reductase [Methanobacteriota archaeon]|nr:MAG: dihydrofolate reductase [Euryarchaeota archaeon]TLZ73403.1 MAG: dihydrofolate reductase [Euryarchaeota archaeon]